MCLHWLEPRLCLAAIYKGHPWAEACLTQWLSLERFQVGETELTETNFAFLRSLELARLGQREREATETS